MLVKIYFHLTSSANFSGAFTINSELLSSGELDLPPSPFSPCFLERLLRLPSVKDDPWAAGFKSTIHKLS